jgi:hypothetical protein
MVLALIFAVVGQMYNKSKNLASWGSIPSVTGILLKIKFFQKKFYYIKR